MPANDSSIERSGPAGAPVQNGTRQMEEAFEAILASRVEPGDEGAFGAQWAEAWSSIREFTLRPGKRLRPRLLMLGYGAAGGESPVPEALWHFAAGLEVAHTFLLVHDDVADRSELRRGGPTLHRTLGQHGSGDDLAVVAGDHLFARATELLLTTNLAASTRATLHFMKVIRHTAAGQYLDLVLSRRPLTQVSPFEARRVADLKTARYSFAAPLACGAILAGASDEVTEGLSRVGRLAGLAFQMQDDLLGIFGDAATTGKPGDADLTEGKRTYPLLMAYQRATAEERAVLDKVGTAHGPEWTAEVRRIIRARGGESSTLRVVERATRAAMRGLSTLGLSEDCVGPIRQLLQALGQRTK